MKQTTFASATWEKKGKVTAAGALPDTDRCGDPLEAPEPELIEPHYPKAGNGTQPMPQERMLRIYFMQQWLRPV